jgi:hypothetical protein
MIGLLGSVRVNGVEPGVGVRGTASRNNPHIPSGKTEVLWEQNAYPGGAYGITDPFPYFTPFLHLDDQASPPLGPKLLAYFNKQSLSGHWYVDVRTSGRYDLVGPVRLDFTARSICF